MTSRGLASLLQTASKGSSSSEDLQLIQQKVRHRPGLLEKLAALYYVWSFGLGIYCWLLAIWLGGLAPARLWPAFAIYIAYIFTQGAEPAQTGSWRPRFRGWPLWRWLAAYFPATLHKTAELPPGRPYIFAFHPHGIVSFSAWLTFASDALGFARLFPGIDCRCLTLRLNFRAPLFREYLLWHGVCDVSKRSCLTLLGRGKSIFIAVGGGTESLHAKPGAHDLVLRRRRGFVKVALRTGASLVPVYAFGENSTFRTANELPPTSLVRRFQRSLTKYTGFTLPLFFGTGFLLPLGLLPYPVPLDIVVGAPLDVPKFEGDESSAEFDALVDKYHGLFVAALQALFEAHREKYAKGEASLQLVE